MKYPFLIEEMRLGSGRSGEKPAGFQPEAPHFFHPCGYLIFGTLFLSMIIDESYIVLRLSLWFFGGFNFSLFVRGLRPCLSGAAPPVGSTSASH